tara:strand:- start:109 stop:594 length:486 start_codon:yes stop_codon:yes gene_type:complete
MLPVWADYNTSIRIRESFEYLVKQKNGTKYPPILLLNEIKETFSVKGINDEILVEPLFVKHGDINALGFKIGSAAYIPDISEFYESSWERVKNLDILIVDALRRAPHPNHSHLEKTLDWIDKLKPKMAYLTNMHNDLDYDTISKETPKNVFPAFDGLTLSL